MAFKQSHAAQWQTRALAQSAFGVCGVALLLFAALPVRAQKAAYPCEPAPDVKAQLDKLEFPDDAQLTRVERLARGKAIFDSLLARSPNDYFVLRALQNFETFSPDADLPTLSEKYRALFEQHPGNPVYLYLYALSLGPMRAAAEEPLRNALEAAPDFPWPHIALAGLYQWNSKLRDLAKAKQEVELFERACPKSLAPYKHIEQIEDKSFLNESAARLSGLLASRTDVEAIQAYPTLWALGFRAHPQSDFDALRMQVAADLKRLRGMNQTENPAWYETLRDGYELTGNAEGARWAEDQIVARFPNSSRSIGIVRSRWNKDHPRLRDAAAPAVQRAYYKAELEAAEEWTRRWPIDPGSWNLRMDALRNLEDVSPEEVRITAQGLLGAISRGTSRGFGWPPAPIEVAELYVKLGVNLQDVPSLVQGSIQHASHDLRGIIYSEDDPDSRKEVERYVEYASWRGWPALVDAYFKLKQPQQVKDVLRQMEQDLEQHRPDNNASQGETATYEHREQVYWERMGRLAEAENRKLEALAYYQKSASLLPLSQRKGLEADPDSAVAGALRLWKSFGGTEASWDELQTRRVAESASGDWERKNQPLPGLNLPDEQGRTWTRADLNGRVTFINVWATWCGPCRAELPSVQKLYEQVKDRKDIQLITLNVDDNPGLIAPFLKQNHYTFPVIPADAYINSMYPNGWEIPINWIVNGKGILQLERTGFGSEADWVGTMLKTLEAVRTLSN